MLNLTRVLVLVAALSIAALGSLAGTVAITFAILGSDADSLVMTTFGVSLIALALGLGLVLAWHTWQAMEGHPSGTFRPRPVWYLGLLFVLAVLAGHVVLSLDLLPVLTFPPFHVVAAVLPALMIVALVGRSLGGITSWREVVFATTSGALLSTGLAFALEVLIAGGFVAAVLVSVAIRPGGLELLQSVSTHLQDPALLQDLAASPAAFLSPAIIVGVLAFVAGIIPAIEEGVKTVGVGLMAYRRPTLPQTFLWGLASGAGFALVEGLLNTSSGLEAWAPVILLRVGATLLHCTTGAFLGLAWYMVLAKRRWDLGIGLYAASVATHSLWNALSVGMAIISLQTVEGGTSGSSFLTAGVSVLLILTLILLLILVLAAGLAGLTWQVRKRVSALDLQEIPSQVAADDGAQA